MTCQFVTTRLYISVIHPTYFSINLARGKQAEQFERSAWNPNSAVNGDYTGTLEGGHCTQTLKNTIGSWWQVDLEAVYDIKLVVILGRRDIGKFNNCADIAKTPIINVLLRRPDNM